MKTPNDVNELVQVLLENRGVTSKPDVDSFLHPIKPTDISLRELGIPLSVIKKFEERILKAKKDNELVVIYGDYDVDGVSATSLLWEFLHLAGVTVFPFVPDRFTDGYGLSVNGVTNLKKQYPAVKLIVAVDNGIVAQKVIQSIQDEKIDVMVVDHHEKDGETNPALAVLHSTKVCGTALVWILVRELAPIFIDRDSQGFLSKQLDIVGLATIADQMNLIGINRSLATFGIIALRKTLRPGLRSLARFAGIILEDAGTYEIGFMLAPRINAMGRLSNAMDAVRLLCTKNTAKADELARTLGEKNNERQKILSEALFEVKKSIDKEASIIIVRGEYHEGIIGLIASRLTDEFNRPAIVISEGETTSKASARSIPTINITSFLRQHESLMLGLGGHEMAAGFSLQTEKLTELIDSMISSSRTLVSKVQETKKTVECKLPFNLINMNTYKKLLEFEPFGMGNPKPLFESDVQINSLRKIGSSNLHLQFKSTDNGLSISSVAFQKGFLFEDLKDGNKYTLIHSLNENVWNGNTSLQLIVKDIYENKNSN